MTSTRALDTNMHHMSVTTSTEGGIFNPRGSTEETIVAIEGPSFEVRGTLEAMVILLPLLHDLNSRLFIQLEDRVPIPGTVLIG